MHSTPCKGLELITDAALRPDANGILRVQTLVLPAFQRGAASSIIFMAMMVLRAIVWKRRHLHH